MKKRIVDHYCLLKSLYIQRFLPLEKVKFLGSTDRRFLIWPFHLDTVLRHGRIICIAFALDGVTALGRQEFRAELPWHQLGWAHMILEELGTRPVLW